MPWTRASYSPSRTNFATERRPGWNHAVRPRWHPAVRPGAGSPDAVVAAQASAQLTDLPSKAAEHRDDQREEGPAE